MYTHFLYMSTHIWCIYYTCIAVCTCVCMHTRAHSLSDAHYYTNSSRRNKVGLLQQITKNKNSHLQ